MNRGRHIRTILLGYAIPITALFILLIGESALTFGPGGEFQSALEMVWFHVFVWLLALTISSAGVALSLFVLQRWLFTIPLPGVLGALGGVAASALFAFGGLGRFPGFGRTGLVITLFVTGAAVGISLAGTAALIGKDGPRTVV